MSGDIQTRQRRKEKRKSKKDEDVTVPGIDTAKYTEPATLMHEGGDHGHGDHGVGWCAKIVFFALSAILAGLVVLIVLENRGGSDLDTPLSESRFSDYLQGWVDEVREEEHHSEPAFGHDDHDHDDDDDDIIPNAPYPEEHDDSTPDETEEAEQELKAEAESIKNAVDDDESDEVPAVEEPIRVKREIVEEVEDDNDEDDDEEMEQNMFDDNDNMPFEEEIKAKPSMKDDTLMLKTVELNEQKIPDVVANKIVTSEELQRQVDELINDYNDVAEMLGKETIPISDNKIIKRETQVDEDISEEDDDDSFEEIVDNDAGEDLLLQKIAQDEHQKQVEKDEQPEQESSSLAVKIGVGVLLAIVAHQIIIKKISATNTINDEIAEEEAAAINRLNVEKDQVLSKRRLTLLSDPNEFCDDPEHGDIDEIVEVMMVAGQFNEADQEYSDEIYSGSEIEDEEYEDEQEEEHEVEEPIFKPTSFEDFNSSYRGRGADVAQKIDTPSSYGGRAADVAQKIEPQSSYRERAADVPQKFDTSTFYSSRAADVPVKIETPSSYSGRAADVPQKFDTSTFYSGRTADVAQKIDTPTKEQKAQSVPQNVEKDIEDQIEKEIVKISQATVKAPEPTKTPLLYPEHYELEAADAEEYDDEEEMDEEEIEYEEDEIESIEEEEEEEEDEIEEDISDIDDDDLMKRLEAKYGKIDDKNNKSDDDADESWTKLPAGSGSQSYSDQLYEDNIPNETITKLYAKAKQLEELADKEKSNKQLRVAIDTYKQILEEHEPELNNKLLKEIAEQCIKRMRFIGLNLQAVDVHQKLINRFDDDPYYRNQLAISYLLINRLAEAKMILHEILLRWRYNGLALVHYGFVLKNLDLNYEDAAIYIQEGLDSNEEETKDGRFYFALGESLQRLGKNDEAMQVYRKGAELKLFLSEYQRSLYNVNGLKSRPFWTKVETKYKDDLMDITKYWQLIRDEGLKLLNEDGTFDDEAENLRDVGDWKQLELFSRGMKTKNCKKAPFTCKLLEKFYPASTCKRGQVKFSVLHPETHVHSHCGPTNCRIRCHLGLKVPPKTFIRVANETRSWKDGEWLIFDDSFEHEVWNNGTSARLVLIVDVWHPDLTDEEKSSMSAI